MVNESRPLKINVGFIANEGAGYSRDFDLNFPTLDLAPDLHLTDVTGMARFTRTSQGLLAEVQLAGIVQADCMRCLNDTDVNLATKFTELYEFDRGSILDSGLQVPDDRIIDLGPLVREYILLDMPSNPVCKPDCLGLCANCGKNLNDTPHTHDEDNIDPRFSALKDLLDKGDK